jgi:hypothetical protein
VDWPRACDVVDIGDAVIITFERPMGRTHHHIQAPISRVLRVLRDMGWIVAGVECDSVGRLCMRLDW